MTYDQNGSLSPILETNGDQVIEEFARFRAEFQTQIGLETNIEVPMDVDLPENEINSDQILENLVRESEDVTKVEKPKSDLQKRLEIALSLFMSGTEIHNSLNNHLFRLLISNLCPELELPPIGLSGDQAVDLCLENAYSNTVDKMKSMLYDASKFTVMLNLVNSISNILCISVAFESSNKIEVLLLSAKTFEFEEGNFIDIQSKITQVSFFLRISNLIPFRHSKVTVSEQSR